MILSFVSIFHYSNFTVNYILKTNKFINSLLLTISLKIFFVFNRCFKNFSYVHILFF